MSSIQSILPAAQAARDQGAWQRASDLYRQADQLMPKQAEITHNLALCLLALGQHREAVAVCAETLAIKPGLWQTQVVQAKCEQALGQIEAADQTYCRILEAHPKQASALSGRADLALNFFGDPLAAAALVEPLLAHPDDAMDAQLTQLMARLYDRDPADTAARLAADAKRFSNAHLQLPGPLLTPKARGNVGRFGRPRVGLLSNQFSVSPVYFLTIAGWQHVANNDDNEGPRIRRYVVDSVEVKVVTERVQYFDAEGKLITESLKDYTRKTLSREFVSLEAFLNRWNSAEKKQVIIEELSREGVFFDALSEEISRDYDPFDLICHIAWDKPPLTRKERAEQVKKRNYFTKYGEQARRVLEALLDKYADEGIVHIEAPQILSIAPFTGFGTPVEIIRLFNGFESYQQAVHDLEQALYSA